MGFLDTIVGDGYQVQVLKGFGHNDFVWQGDLRICEVLLGISVEIELCQECRWGIAAKPGESQGKQSDEQRQTRRSVAPRLMFSRVVLQTKEHEVSTASVHLNAGWQPRESPSAADIIEGLNGL